MSDYTFPFSTCERPHKKGLAQPYSVIFNIIICTIVIYFLLQTKNKYSFFLLFSILLFELFHTFSHSVHLDSTIQTNMTHFLAYLVNFAYFITLYNYSHHFPSYIFVIYLGAVILFDLYAFNKLSFMYYLTTQFLIFFSLFIYYYRFFPKSMKNRIPLIFGLVFLVLLLFLNENMNCENMLKLFPNFPFHILIEMSAVVIAYNICKVFYLL